MKEQDSNDSDPKQSLGIPRIRKVASIFCPYFCRTKRKPDPIVVEEKHQCQLSEVQLEAICNHLGVDKGDGFSGIFPYMLHNIWEEFMMPDLYEIWILYIYGSMDQILPDYRKFCELVIGQWSASLEIKVNTILAILRQRNYDEIETMNFEVIRYDVMKYFFNLVATYLRGMGFRNNPEFLMWVSCEADLNECNLRIAMRYFTDLLPDKVGKQELYNLMETFPILNEVLESVIEMSFGIAPVSHCLIPFPISFTQTVLDIAQIILLTSFVKEGGDLYEWEMLYSMAVHGCNWTYLVKSIVDKGPTIIVVKDQEGWIFGGYGCNSWRIASKFFGSEKCFLFRLVPTFKIYRSSGVDENYMYLNHRQYTMPNGLAMGGRLGYFGIWINIDRPMGRCESNCNTFEDFECLSNDNSFFYLNLEVWRVSPKSLGVARRSTSASEGVTVNESVRPLVSVNEE